MSALEHLKLWKIYQDHWCEHKPSVTINYKDSEYVEIGNWVWNNFNEISGVSFLPSSDHVYQQAPYEEITAEEYKNLKAGMPDVNFTNFNEEVDNTISSQELACVAGACEI
jgi:ribonucleoside-diphosphate reductase alpha chain